MSPRRVEIIRRSSGWLTAAALLTLVPKCVLCAAAYVGLGAALGLGGPELCGGSSSPTVPWALRLSALVVTLGVISLVTSFRCHHARTELAAKTSPALPG